MRVYLGSDHGGFQQKRRLIDWLDGRGIEAVDKGDFEATPEDDYPDYALAVGRAVQEDPGSFGILLCRSGEGMAMAANKLPGIRAAVAWNLRAAAETREDNDANVLVIPSDFVPDEQAPRIAEAFLTTPFSGEERHVRRLAKIATIERMIVHEA